MSSSVSLLRVARTATLATAWAVAFLLAAPATAGAASDGFGIRPEEGQVERLYQAVFGREPDGAGFEYWARLRASGVGLEVVADSFAASEEYRLRFTADSDADFVARLYDNVLGRELDVDGARYWEGVLADGVDRVDVLLFFSESPEFAIATDTELVPLPTFAVERTDATEEMLGVTWRAGCPVPVAELSVLSVPHLGFDGAVTTGELVVSDQAVDATIELFSAMYAARMPIESIRPASDFGGDDDALMSANVTSAFNCRTIAGTSRWSRHAHGQAIDINPLFNPEVSGDSVRPIEGIDWADRDRYHPAMLRAGDPLIETADRLGWIWGGRWNSLSDPQHLEMPR